MSLPIQLIRLYSQNIQIQLKRRISLFAFLFNRLRINEQTRYNSVTAHECDAQMKSQRKIQDHLLNVFEVAVSPA